MKVHRISIGSTGVPKAEVPQAMFTFAGVAGDVNRYRARKHGGTPTMAVSLVSTATLAALAEEGWPVAPGDLGENLTLEGLAPEALAPGLRLTVGAQVRIELTLACTPCDNLADLPYVGDARIARFLKATLGRRGWYARVLAEGLVRRGDPAAIVG
jgi:MOSC domain-containing protein YiiM